MKGLTEKQKSILDFIEEFSGIERMSPTVYEIAQNFNIKTSTVFAHIRALQRKGALTRSSKARSIALTKPHRKTRNPTGLREIPVHEGEDYVRKLFCDASFVGARSVMEVRNLYALRVHGASLRPYGIYDGDIVIIRKYPNRLKRGDIILMSGGSFYGCAKVEGDDVECFSLDARKQRSAFHLSEDPPRGVIIGLQRKF